MRNRRVKKQQRKISAMRAQSAALEKEMLNKSRTELLRIKKMAEELLAQLEVPIHKGRKIS